MPSGINYRPVQIIVAAVKIKKIKKTLQASQATNGGV
jgi:hypothetical protein